MFQNMSTQFETETSGTNYSNYPQNPAPNYSFVLLLNSPISHCLTQIPSAARFRPHRTDVTTNPRGACPSSVAPLVGPFPSVLFCSIQMRRDPKSLWTLPKRPSRGRPVSAMPSPSATGPQRCMSKSASRYFVSMAPKSDFSFYSFYLNLVLKTWVCADFQSRVKWRHSSNFNMTPIKTHLVLSSPLLLDY